MELCQALEELYAYGKLIRLVNMTMQGPKYVLRTDENLSDDFDTDSGIYNKRRWSCLSTLQPEKAVRKSEIQITGILFNKLVHQLVYTDDFDITGRSKRALRERDSN